MTQTRHIGVLLLFLVSVSLYLMTTLTFTFQGHYTTYSKNVRRKWSPQRDHYDPVRVTSLDARPLFNATLPSSELLTHMTEKQRRLPACLIIGFSKCGTTALRAFLTLHPDIVSPLREIRFFTLHHGKGLEWYRHQMPLSLESDITLEKSAGYITSSESLERIRRFNSSIKLIVMVRDPITRLQSEYARCVSHKEASKAPSFTDWCGRNARSATVLRLVDYASQLRNVYSRFSKRQVLVLSEEALENVPLDVLQEVESFLGLRPAFSKADIVYNEQKGFYCFNTTGSNYPEIAGSVVLNEKTGCLGSHKGRAHPDIDSHFLEELVEAVRPFNERLFRLIGKRFRWSHFED